MMWQVTLGALRWRRCRKPEFYTACGVINNKIYVAGGSDGDNVRNNLYIYDIATNSWTSRNTHAGRLPNPRVARSSTANSG